MEHVLAHLQSGIFYKHLLTLNLLCMAAELIKIGSNSDRII